MIQSQTATMTLNDLEGSFQHALTFRGNANISALAKETR